jgi:Flp pilus assembly protein TadG
MAVSSQVVVALVWACKKAKEDGAMKSRKSLFKDSSGAGAVAFIVMLAVFFGLLAVVIDLGRLLLVKNQLQNAGDDCALAGARAFLPYDLSGTTFTVTSGWEQQMRSNATSKASQDIGDNRSDAAVLTTLPQTDVQTGIQNFDADNLPKGFSTSWIDWSNATVVASYYGKHIGPAVQLPVKKTADYNAGPVSMTLANVFNIQAVSVTAHSTAWLSPLGGFGPHNPTVPFGAWNDNPNLYPGGIIDGVFRNDGSDTIGWSNLEDQSAPGAKNTNASTVKSILDDPTGSNTPSTAFGSPVSIQNGVASSCVKAMINNTDRFGWIPATDGSGGYVPDPVTLNPLTGGEGSINPTEVTYAQTVYIMPLYDKSGNYTFNQSGMVGGIPVYLTEIWDSPNNEIKVTIAGGTYAMNGPGGGAFYGVLSTVPQLVQ